LVEFTIVANAGPLIHLARINKLHLLQDLFKEVYIPEAVKNETLNKGKAEGYADALAIEGAMSLGWIKVVQTENNAEKLAEEAKIGKGEAEAILLAKQMSTTKILMDDDRARRVARSLGLKPHGTIYILKLALVRKILTKAEYTQVLQKALDAGLYLSTELYLRALKGNEGQD